MTLIPTLKHKSRASYANAGHGQRRRQEAAKQRGITPLTYQRMLAKHEAGMNVVREFTRHACNNPPDESNGGEFAAFVHLGRQYSYDPDSKSYIIISECATVESDPTDFKCGIPAVQPSNRPKAA